MTDHLCYDTHGWLNAPVPHVHEDRPPTPCHLCGEPGDPDDWHMMKFHPQLDPPREDGAKAIIRIAYQSHPTDICQLNVLKRIEEKLDTLVGNQPARWCYVCDRIIADSETPLLKGTVFGKPMYLCGDCEEKG